MEFTTGPCVRTKVRCDQRRTQRQVERLELAAEDTERRSAEERKPQRPVGVEASCARWSPKQLRANEGHTLENRLLSGS